MEKSIARTDHRTRNKERQYQIRQEFRLEIDINAEQFGQNGMGIELKRI
jgi:hypothetical protein